MIDLSSLEQINPGNSKSQGSYITKSRNPESKENMVLSNYFHKKAHTIIFTNKVMKGLWVVLLVSIIFQGMIVIQLIVGYSRYSLRLNFNGRINKLIEGPNIALEMIRGEIGYVDAIDSTLTLMRKKVISPSSSQVYFGKDLNEMIGDIRDSIKVKDLRYYKLRCDELVNLELDYILDHNIGPKKEVKMIVLRQSQEYYQPFGQLEGQEIGDEDWMSLDIHTELGLLHQSQNMKLHLNLPLNYSDWTGKDTGVSDLVMESLRRNLMRDFKEDSYDRLNLINSLLRMLGSSLWRGLLLVESICILINIVLLTVSAVLFTYIKHTMDRVNSLLFSMRVGAHDTDEWCMFVHEGVRCHEGNTRQHRA